MLQLIKRFCNNTYGIAATEFALAFPFLLFLLLGGLETNRFIIAHQKAEKVAYTVTDIISQSTSITAAQMDQMLTAAAQIMEPYGFDTEGVAIVSSVYQSGTTNPPTIRWQYDGGGTLSRTSKIGTVNNNATLPGSLTLNDRDNVIVAEIYYRYDPMFPSVLMGSQDVYKVALFKPRLGALTTTPN